METAGKWIKTGDLHDLYYRWWISRDLIAIPKDNPSDSEAVLFCVGLSGFIMVFEYPSQHVHHHSKMFKG